MKKRRTLELMSNHQPEAIRPNRIADKVWSCIPDVQDGARSAAYAALEHLDSEEWRLG